MVNHDGTVRTPNYMVASADQLATSAGNQMFAKGGNAVDAAIATNAAIAVIGPHLCGMGGDLFALVSVGGEVFALNSSGRAGSGADADQLRSEGATEMPYRHDIPFRDCARVCRRVDCAARTVRLAAFGRCACACATAGRRRIPG